MSIQSKAENLLNYITGSAGGWPNNTHIGIMQVLIILKKQVPMISTLMK